MWDCDARRRLVDHSGTRRLGAHRRLSPAGAHVTQALLELAA